MCIVPYLSSLFSTLFENSPMLICVAMVFVIFKTHECIIVYLSAFPTVDMSSVFSFWLLKTVLQ